MILRRRLFLVSTAALVLASRDAGADKAARKAKVAVLFAASLETYYAVFKTQLRSLGYVEGQNLLLEARWADGKVERLPALAAELVALKPDVVVASSTPAIRALKEATRTIPIVMATSADSVRSGFVASLARPGGNITGNSAMNFDLSLKTIELLHKASPRVKRVGLLLTRDSAYNPQLTEIVEGVRGLGVSIIALRANTSEEIERAFDSMVKDGIGALVVFGDSVFVAHRRTIAALAADRKIPAIYQWRSHVEDGGLMSFGPDIGSFWKAAAVYVDRILKGADPAVLPVQQPTVFELVINLNAARALGLKISEEMLLRADSVIE
jgi:putative ABC transport system substrate-binding protein